MTKQRKLAIISDFHLDSNAFSTDELQIFVDLLMELNITDLHFAGDISNDFWKISEPFLTQIKTLTPLSVTFNLGNHDMVGLNEDEIAQSNFQVTYFADTAFVSFHGWYDYSLMDGAIDPAKILAFKNAFYFDRKIKRAFDDVTTTQNELSELENLLTKLSENPSVKKIVVSTHFVPHQQFIINSRYEKFARFNAYLGSQHFHELFVQFPKITDVVFGHLHQRRKEMTIDGIHYQSKPLGYAYEWQLISDFLLTYPHFQIKENWHLRKRYNNLRQSNEWQNFRQKHLAEEFRRALVIFEF